MEPLHGIRLQHIHAFEEVAEASSFTRAARLLHITQSALSRQVRQLEDSLGVELLDRSSARLELTPAGRAFKLECTSVWTQLEYAVNRARQVECGATTLRLGFSDYVNVSPVGALLDAYARAAPDGAFVQREFDDAEAWRALELREVDAIIVPTYEPVGRARTLTLTRCDHVAFMSREHPAASAEDGVAMADLADSTILLPSARRYPACVDYLDGRYADAGVELEHTPHAYSILTIMRLLSDARTVFIGPRWYASVMPEGLVHQTLSEVDTRIPLSLVWYDESTDALAEFVSLLRDRLGHELEDASARSTA
jgi:DNA-binding transcriptional LysR family regulator